MQTFLPYSSFEASVRILDGQRLGKQRVETMQIMQTLLGLRVTNDKRMEPTGYTRVVYYDEEGMECDELDLDPGKLYSRVVEPAFHLVHLPKSSWRVEEFNPKGWVNHPAVNMWRGYEWSLLHYQKATVDEYRRRGYNDKVCFDKTFMIFFHDLGRDFSNEVPPWLGSINFHQSHKSNLLRKNPEYYGSIFQGVPDDLEYVWPGKE